MIIFPYKNGSEGAKALADALGVKQMKRENSRWKGGMEKLVVNWGSSTSTEEVDKSTVLNTPAAVAIAADKLAFFRKIEEANERRVSNDDFTKIPNFTADIDTARWWIREGRTVVCRTVLNGHSGRGIVIADRVEDLVEAPLYVLYIPKKSEWRIHVMAGEVVDIQRKIRNPETPDDEVNWKVRNHGNGFIFVRGDNADCPAQVKHHAINAVKAIGLHFGAVDMIYNEKNDRAYVLEINTAPGLTGQTLEGYTNRMSHIRDSWFEYMKTVQGRGPIGDNWLDDILAD